MNKIILIVVVLLVVVAISYQHDSLYEKKFGNKVEEIKESVTQNFTKTLSQTVEIGPTEDGRTLRELDQRVSLHALEVAEILQPPSDKDLETLWQYAYGCGQLPKEDVEACEFDTMFNAESLEEALWMKRNGFPHRAMIEQLRDQSSHEAIVELARNDYKPAIVLAALVSSGFDMHKDAIRWAARLQTLSNPTDVYAHRLMGDVTAAKDPLSTYVLQSYLIAEYLGDYEAEVLVSSHAYDNPTHIRHAVELAQDYVYRYMGVTVRELPLDPRPGGGGG